MSPAGRRSTRKGYRCPCQAGTQSSERSRLYQARGRELRIRLLPKRRPPGKCHSAVLRGACLVGTTPKRVQVQRDRGSTRREPSLATRAFAGTSVVHDDDPRRSVRRREWSSRRSWSRSTCARRTTVPGSITAAGICRARSSWSNVCRQGRRMSLAPGLLSFEPQRAAIETEPEGAESRGLLLVERRYGPRPERGAKLRPETQPRRRAIYA